MRWVVLVAGLAFASSAAAAPERSARPDLRPDLASLKGAAQIELASVVPTMRPVVQKALVPGRDSSVRPDPRPGKIARQARGLLQGLFHKTGARVPKGSVCGDPTILGKVVAPVSGRISGCGIEAPVRITAVSGVSLSQAATIDCPTAKALKSWLDEGVKPAIKRKGGGVAGLRVAAHYACRTRNNKKGAKISEHGRGRAIDISAIVLKDGSRLTVSDDWRSRNSKIMRRIHKAACGPFGTVLGPDADRYHQNHFHLDTARYRSGPYCR